MSGYKHVSIVEVAQDRLISDDPRAILHSWLRNSLHSPPPINIMKLFASKFTQTLILNVATIAAIIVGTIQFLVRSYKDNNGPEKTRKMMQTVLQFVDTINAQLLTQINTDVPVVKVAQKTTKRR